MKILVIGDVHWSQYSSIVRKRGIRYSYRLENLIQSVNWAEDIAKQNDCEMIVFLGDFFDKSELNAEELSALDNIKWSDIKHYFLVGNHEAGRHDLAFNSANIFKLTNAKVIDHVFFISDVTGSGGREKLLFLPYITEAERKPLIEYVNDPMIKNDDYIRTIIFSHNDIKGIQMGHFISKEGFKIEDIQQCCDLYLNGHIHNGCKVADNIINVGNLTGQNFSEDAFLYDHSVVLLDTDTLRCAVYENPYALNFYKLDLTNSTIDDVNDTFAKLKQNCVVTIKCDEKDSEYLRSKFDSKHLSDLCNVVESRFIIQPHVSDVVVYKEETFSVDHLEEFKKYMLEHFENNDILISELQEVCV